MKNNINEAMALSFNAAIVKFLAADVMFNFIYESLKKIKNTETLYKKISRMDRKQFDYYFHEMETICILVERILTHSYNMIVEKE